MATDLRPDCLAELMAEFRAEQLSGEVQQLDVCDQGEVEQLVRAVEARRPISLLANVAGVLAMAPVVELDHRAWRYVFSVNCDGVFHVSRAVARGMIKRRSGSIVTVGSNAGRTPRVQMAAYAASKAATSMFMKCLGLELASHGIRCNVVSPGSTDTPMQRALWRDEQAPARVIAGVPSDFRVGIPLGRIAEPGDVVETALFLLSDRSRHVTMHDLVVDGGATLGV